MQQSTSSHPGVPLAEVQLPAPAVHAVNTQGVCAWDQAACDLRNTVCSLASGRFDEAKEMFIESLKPLRSSTRGIRLMVFRRMIDLYEATGEPDKATRYETMLSDLLPNKD
ncbi:MAG: hypothetical protein IH897_13785 [Planctomycetes bacterium]|nr:hypothetical protein [Planctomycetota bacterium]